MELRKGKRDIALVWIWNRGFPAAGKGDVYSLIPIRISYDFMFLSRSLDDIPSHNWVTEQPFYSIILY